MFRDRGNQRAALIVVGMVAASVLGLWWPQHRQERALRQRQAAAQSAFQGDRGGVNNLAGLARDVMRLQQDMDQARRAVPGATEQAELLRRLSQHMVNCGLADQQLVTRPIQSGPDYAALPVRLDFRGSFPQMFHLLQRVESMRQIVRVVKLEFDSDLRRPDEPLSGWIEMFAFFQSGEVQP